MGMDWWHSAKITSIGEKKGGSMAPNPIVYDWTHFIRWVAYYTALPWKTLYLKRMNDSVGYCVLLINTLEEYKTLINVHHY